MGRLTEMDENEARAGTRRVIESDDLLILVDRLARIETKLDQALSNHADHEKRIRLVERWKYALPVSALAAIAAGAVAIFGK